MSSILASPTSPSIKDVAQRAGVSTTTVSRVLTDADAVRPVLRERVQQAIAELGWRPSLAARRLRQRRTSLIGLVVADIRNPFFTAISRAVEDMAYAAGLRLILCNSDEDPAKEQSYLELMADERASGVILAPTLEFTERPQSGPWPFPLVMVDRAPASNAADAVLLDNVAAAGELTRHLLAQGCRRIALLAGSQSSTGRQRQSGYEAALREAGLAPRVLALRPDAQAGQEGAAQLLAEPPGTRPDALLATSGLLLLGAWRAARAAALALPHDLALAGFDDNDWTTMTEPAITVLAQPTQDIGRSAAELLLQRMAEPDRAPRRIVLQGQLLVRGSSLRAGAVSAR
ncbi:LacI family DNA-binding transcriptional regulator [Pseudorhodoferax sp. Leaf265]|jgi:LacI family fructose operon transcriptional repressor|uniref:LacI family DNA-binding transcriptional regulator n=1 Tax=Pseudorhodoferax sp. Leaf265 TaxID=1736315 RepID=UPI0006FEA0DA|nr:LacI family DNA-binding transcriptional regulator [Pseudorhodoferax sp. Leaf265]KQP20384.1 LacI family transcriptional regulator [Pseudorhodoferax sp. Leaf265]